MLLSLGFFPATLRGHTENGSKIRRTQRTSQGISTLYATIHAKEVHPCSPSIFVYLDKLPWISIECLMFLYITNWKPQEIQLTTVWDVLRKPCKQWHKNCQPPEFTRFLVAIKSRKRYLLRIRNPTEPETTTTAATDLGKNREEVLTLIPCSTSRRFESMSHNGYSEKKNLKSLDSNDIIWFSIRTLLGSYWNFHSSNRYSNHNGWWWQLLLRVKTPLTWSDRYLLMKFLSLSFPDTPATPPWVKHFLGMISFLSAATDISSLFSSHLYSKKTMA